ncbi:MAG: glycerophosphodiester phosphodiesterase, partial [Parachlamydiaceae bacterium]
MKVIAHRGASLELPENTIESIILAFSLDVDAVEIDVHLSKDEIPVVIHDDSLVRTHGVDRFVHDCLASDLPVPTLAQVLELKRDCYLMIEVKEGRHDG